MERVDRLCHRPLARARRTVDEDLLLGADHPPPRMAASALYGSEHRTESGWWFGMGPRNAAVLQNRGKRLVEHIHATSTLRGMFPSEDEEWRASSIRPSTHRFQDVLEYLFVLVRILRPPPQGLELLSMTLVEHGRASEYFAQARLGHVVHLLP